MLPFVFRDGVIKNNKIYTFGLDGAVLCSVDLYNEKVQIEYIYDTREYGVIRFDQMMYCDNDEIIAVSMDGKYIIRDNIESHDFKIVETGYSNNEDSNFCGIIRVKDEIIIFTKYYGIMLVYNINNNSIKQDTYPAENDEYRTLVKGNDEIWLIPRNGKRVLNLSFKTMKWEIITLQESLQECVHAVLDGEHFFFLQSNGIIIEWDYVREYYEKKLVAEDVYNEQQTASRLCVLKDKIIILPGLANNIVILEKGQSQARIYEDYPKDFVYDESKAHWAKYVHYTETDSAVFFSCRTSDYILMIDKNTQKIYWKKSLLSENERMKYRIAKEQVIVEQGDDLLHFIHAI